MSSTFSVMEATQKIMKECSIDVDASVDLDRYAAKSGETTQVRATATGLLGWCRDIEKTIINRPLRDSVVMAGFERFSRARFVEKRYVAIADLSHELHVFGQADGKLEFPVTHLHVVTTGPLVLEWFLIVKHPSFDGLLSARDLDGFDSRVSPRERRFEGVITHDKRVVDQVIEEIREHFPVD